MNYSQALERLCSRKIGVFLQAYPVETLLEETMKEDEASSLFDCAAQADAQILIKAPNVLVTLSFEEREAYEKFASGLEEMNHLPPQDGKAVADILSLSDLQEDAEEEIVYAAGFVGMTMADREKLQVQFLFPAGEFSVYEILPEEERKLCPAQILELPQDREKRKAGSRERMQDEI